MTQFWQPSFDPMDELIQSRQRIKLLETNQQEIIRAQNDQGQKLHRLMSECEKLVDAVLEQRSKIKDLQQQLESHRHL